MEKYKYTGNASFEDAYHDCKLVADSIIDEESFQKADKGLVLYYMDRILEALEKQIPKIVELHSWSPARCPSCGTELSKSVGDGYYKHLTNLHVCPNIECCQKLKWREDEEIN